MASVVPFGRLVATDTVIDWPTTGATGAKDTSSVVVVGSGGFTVTVAWSCEGRNSLLPAKAAVTGVAPVAAKVIWQEPAFDITVIEQPLPPVTVTVLPS